MDKINIAELLKDCPKGMELDCIMLEGSVVFEDISEDDEYPIGITLKNGDYTNLTKYGQYLNLEEAKCVIFPKGKTTWEGFQRPFKDGDIIFTRTGNYSWISIFKQFSGKSCCTYIDLCINDNDLISDTYTLCNIEDIITQCLAFEEEKQKLFDAIKENGYKWNPETKTLEKVNKPIFKKGDKVRVKNGVSKPRIIDEVFDTFYSLQMLGKINFTDQDNWELVPNTNKFDIITLVPFESRVLARDNGREKWIPAFWGFYDVNSDFPYKLIGCIARYCIPFVGNEYLLGTTDDCDEYFKTWEK